MARDVAASCLHVSNLEHTYVVGHHIVARRRTWSPM
jgi:hypothetical protein